MAVVFIVIISIPVIYFIYVILIGPALNDRQGAKIEKELLAIELPADTEIVDSYSVCFNSSGTGNHVEIWAGVLIQTSLPQDEFYEFFTLNSDYEPMPAVYLENCSSYSYIKFKSLGGVSDLEGYYVLGGFYSAYTQQDLRGH